MDLEFFHIGWQFRFEVDTFGYISFGKIKVMSGVAKLMTTSATIAVSRTWNR